MIKASHGRQAEAVIDQDPSKRSVAYEKMNDAWYNDVKGQDLSTAPHKYLLKIRLREQGLRP